MKLERTIPAVLLVAFSALTAEAIARDGYFEWMRLSFAHLSSALVLTDLTIALLLVMAWMVKDARARDATVWPYLILTLVLGSMGPLTYLVVRSLSAPQRSTNDPEKRAPGGLGLERDESLT